MTNKTQHTTRQPTQHFTRRLTSPHASALALVSALCALLARPSLGQDAACPGFRYVGIRSSPRCPVPESSQQAGRWVSVPLTGTTKAPGLARFCGYDWVPSDPQRPTPPNPEGLPRDGAIPASVWLAPDCHVVAPLAPYSFSDLPQVAGPLRDATLKALGALAALPVGPVAPSPVRVAVVDSAVERSSVGGSAGWGRLAHGRVMGRLIRELSCPTDTPSPAAATSACIGAVTSHLALPHLTPTVVDEKRGGFFGTQSQLGQAILRAVESWRASDAPERRLVVNLSVGWEAKKEERSRAGAAKWPQAGSHEPGPVQLVRAAITHAVCRGALVVAAAGNRTAGPSPGEGPMVPAAWESTPAPSPDECARFEGEHVEEQGSGKEPYRPLVYAVAAVDGADRFLSSTRPLSRPGLAGYGHHVSVSDGALATEVLSGTSLSAAAFSGIAATVWGYRPSLTAHEVAQLIYDAAPSLSPSPDGTPAEAELCLGSCAGRDIRRVSLCSALAKACASKAEACPEEVKCESVAPYAGSNVAWDPVDWDAALSSVDGPPPPLPAPLPCLGGACFTAADAVPTKAAVPWVDPQPGWSGCDVCALSGVGLGHAALSVTLRPDFYAWSNVALVLNAGPASAVYDLSALIQSFAPQPVWQVTGIPIPPAFQGAQLVFGFPGYATVDPVLSF